MAIFPLYIPAEGVGKGIPSRIRYRPFSSTVQARFQSLARFQAPSPPAMDRHQGSGETSVDGYIPRGRRRPRHALGRFQAKSGYLPGSVFRVMPHPPILLDTSADFDDALYSADFRLSLPLARPAALPEEEMRRNRRSFRTSSNSDAFRVVVGQYQLLRN